MQRLKDKTAIVTGAAQGLGEAMAERFVSEGCRVVIADINGAGAEATAERLSANGGQTLAVKVDVTNRAEVTALFDKAEQSFGTVDVLVNNAGIFGNARFEEMTDEEWRRMLSINVDGVFIVSQIAIQRLLAAKMPASIINMASVSANVGFTDSTHYSATKGAVAALTRCLAAEFGHCGIRTNSISPGLMATEMTVPAFSVPELAEAWTLRVASRRWGTPNEVASVAAFLASEDASYVNGAEIVVDGGATPNFPKPSDATR